MSDQTISADNTVTSEVNDHIDSLADQQQVAFHKTLERDSIPHSNGQTSNIIMAQKADSSRITPNGENTATDGSKRVQMHADSKDAPHKGIRTSELTACERFGIHVWEFTLNNGAVSIRQSDTSLNITQLAEALRSVLPDKAESILLAASKGMHESNENGTWIPLQRAISLCRSHNLYGALSDVFKAASSKASKLNTKGSSTRTYSEMDADATIPDSEISSPKKPKLTEVKVEPIKIYNHDIRMMNSGRQSGVKYEDEASGKTLHIQHSLKAIPESDVDEKSKVVLSSLFLPNQKNVTLMQLLEGDEDQLRAVIIDTPIDDNGQTALHLAATLGKISLAEDLVSRGANRFRGDLEGQTALVRAIHATNCYEENSFDELLDLLYPVIGVVDNKGRTILHHIAYTCGRKGCSDACKYYLETLLEWIVKRGPTLPEGQAIGLSEFIKHVVNLPDRNGDTCLNIAAMVGNKHIIQQLLEVGADPTKPNKAGVRPVDCGIGLEGDFKAGIGGKSGSENGGDGTNSARNKAGSLNQSEVLLAASEADKSAANDASTATSNSLQILDSITQFMEQLGKDFKDEMLRKSKQIGNLHPSIRKKTLLLSEKRKQYEKLQKMVLAITDYQNKIGNLNKAIQEEDQKFREEAQQLPIDTSTFSGNFDADEPFTVWPVFNEVEKLAYQRLAEKRKKMQLVGDGNAEKEQELSEELLGEIKAEDIMEQVKAAIKEKQKTSNEEMDLPPKIVLEARIKAYKKNNEELLKKMKARRSSSRDLEQQFKRVISLCIGSKPEDIDEKLLSSLLSSVENDPNPEINQVKKVLEIVNDMEK
ncbi:hypothetical protein HII13_002154 [Brettanomyces bruxellensis]|nr:hypothetical protein HII13_002154 [Brettanomyces bruxellensis]